MRPSTDGAASKVSEPDRDEALRLATLGVVAVDLIVAATVGDVSVDGLSSSTPDSFDASLDDLFTLLTAFGDNAAGRVFGFTLVDDAPIAGAFVTLLDARFLIEEAVVFGWVAFEVEVEVGEGDVDEEIEGEGEGEDDDGVATGSDCWWFRVVTGSFNAADCFISILNVNGFCSVVTDSLLYRLNPPRNME